ncbi:lipoprotein [Spiroplasma endosymbiont of Glossina fuscipes fuscipes]|uniref:lipoprotein n=1 Tax=Spiroplasma endosymbiont of Glossina fuscipes fuscipes TaxID=2004463 RepID=UPI003C7393CB
MKKLLSILGAIGLIATSSTSLVACNKTQQEYTKEELEHLKKENQIDTTDQTIKNNLEWIAPQEKPFNQVDNKWYYVVSRFDKNNNWEIFKFKNEKLEYGYILKTSNPNFDISYWQVFSDYTTIGIIKNDDWATFKGWRNLNDHFKSVYRWNLDTTEPDLIVDNDGNVKVKDE